MLTGKPERKIEYFSVSPECSIFLCISIDENGKVHETAHCLAFLNHPNTSNFQPIWVSIKERSLLKKTSSYYENFYTVEDVAEFMKSRSESAFMAFVKQFV